MHHGPPYIVLGTFIVTVKTPPPGRFVQSEELRRSAPRVKQKKCKCVDRVAVDVLLQL